MKAIASAPCSSAEMRSFFFESTRVAWMFSPITTKSEAVMFTSRPLFAAVASIGGHISKKVFAQALVLRRA